MLSVHLDDHYLITKRFNTIEQFRNNVPKFSKNIFKNIIKVFQSVILYFLCKCNSNAHTIE